MKGLLASALLLGLGSAISAQTIHIKDGIDATVINKPLQCPLPVKEGHLIGIEYELKVKNKVIDRTEDDDPLVFIVGADHAIDGLDLGVRGMCVGEVRKLVIDPKYAYGDKGFKDVPPNTAVEFIVELVHVESPPNIFKEIDVNNDKKISRAELRHWLIDSEILSASDVEEGVKGIFEAEDLNKDGFISFEEFSGPKGL